MDILIACEQFGNVRSAFRANGHNAWSCDIEPTRDDSPYHIQDDVRKHLDGWDIIIGFPPCTYLSNANKCRFAASDYEGKNEFDRQRKMATEFVYEIYDACDMVCIENPVGILSVQWRKPDQVINPYQFGHPFKKRTCLWLKNLPLLQTTEWVGSMHPSFAIVTNRAIFKSQTFPGIAKAMADQWGIAKISKNERTRQCM